MFFFTIDNVFDLNDVSCENQLESKKPQIEGAKAKDKDVETTVIS
jgi:hypothetical protein